ncbi:MAG TPA: D-alanyl-D-alanine carboxypeptidase family protein [Actinomycetota bacterium]|nr:D-alanyl-D-alanine carboxypeptidase family protein [Actinomycetota bacterium]
MPGDDLPVRAVRRQRAAQRRRNRRFLALVIVGIVVLGGVLAYRALTASAIEIPEDPCAERVPLRNVDGVRLQPVAMRAFLQAQRDAGVDISVVQSYRSCPEQRRACEGICGNPQGCPGLCAPPGLSWHQLGAAVDITEEGVADPVIVLALESNGWCQALPDSDPGHFSFDGCH